MKLSTRIIAQTEYRSHRNGCEVLRKNGAIFIGMSPGNSFFSEQNILALIYGALQFTPKQIFIVIPDAYYSYAALDLLSKSASRSPSRKNTKCTNQLTNKVNRVLMHDKIKCHKDIIHLQKWHDLVGFQAYAEHLSFLKGLALRDYGYEACLIDQTSGFLRGNLSKKERVDDAVFDQAVSIAKRYVQQEVAAIAAVYEYYSIKDIGLTVFYHNPWVLVEKLFSGCFLTDRYSQLGYLTVHCSFDNAKANAVVG